MNRIAITIIAAILTCSAAAAQNFSRHEFSANIGGGMSGFQTRTTIGKDHWKGAVTAGLGYHYFLNQQWSIGTGVNFAVYKGSISIKDYDQQHNATNESSGTVFHFLISSSRYDETQRAMMIAIPLMAQYQYRFDGKTAFFAALGLKAGIPASVKYQSKGAYTTKGHYPSLNVTYKDLPEYGFVTDQPFPENNTNLSLKTALMASAELGVKWPLGETSSMYTGIYFDYGLNNLSKKGDQANNTLVVYQSGTPPQLAYNTAACSYSKKMAPLAAGITLRFAFGMAGM